MGNVTKKGPDKKHKKHFWLSKSSFKSLDFDVSLGDLKSFPNEIFLAIIRHLSISDLGHLCLVSKGIFVLASDDIIWHTRYKNAKLYYPHLQKKRLSKKVKGEQADAQESGNTLTYCCWKKHFICHYFSIEEIKAREEGEHRRISKKS